MIWLLIDVVYLLGYILPSNPASSTNRWSPHPHSYLKYESCRQGVRNYLCPRSVRLLRINWNSLESGIVHTASSLLAHYLLSDRILVEPRVNLVLIRPVSLIGLRYHGGECGIEWPSGSRGMQFYIGHMVSLFPVLVY